MSPCKIVIGTKRETRSINTELNHNRGLWVTVENLHISQGMFSFLVMLLIATRGVFPMWDRMLGKIFAVDSLKKQSTNQSIHQGCLYQCFVPQQYLRLQFTNRRAQSSVVTVSKD